MLDVPILKNGRQDLTNLVLHEQTITQKLGGRGIGISNLHLVAYTTTTQVLVQHQGCFYRCNTALVRDVMSFGEGDRYQHTALFQLAQAVRQLARRRMLIEMITALFQAFDFFR